jgi:hypothetical protein
MENSDTHDEQELPRPPGLTLLGGLYLFFFLLTVSSYGQPIPFFGAIYQGTPAGIMVFFDSLICLYLFLGLLKRQYLTWYLLLGYNTFEVVNTLTNLLAISSTELENIVGKKVDTSGLISGNILVIVAILLLSGFIFRHRDYFINRSKYLF